ncbi:MAG: hypothetical protein LAN83_03965 [Acidobacteriia bacterium]|nr:hypothetical protein [Terriglobia bacterium]
MKLLRDMKSGPLKLLIVAPLFLATIFAVSIAGLAFYCSHRCGGQGKSNLIRVLRLLLAGPPLLVLGIVALCVGATSWCALCLVTSFSRRARCRNCGAADAVAEHDLCQACLEVNATEAGTAGPAVLNQLETDMACTTQNWLPPRWLSVPLENGEVSIVARNSDEGSA